jgi:YVTN family beta-propeller protein
MGPQTVAVDPTGSRVYATTVVPGNLSVIDTATNTVVATVATGTSPGGIAVNPAGTRVYVSNFDSNNVTVIDSATNTVVSTVAVGSSPFGIDVNPAGTRVYVANFESNNVSVIDTATNAVIATIAVGVAPVALGQFIGPAGASSQSLNYQGLWWNAPAGSESGWGINFAHQGDTIFASWFTYDVTGKGWWLVMTAAKSAPNIYEGTLYQTRGPAFSAVPFDPAQVVSAPVGSGKLSFTDENNGNFAYTVNGVSQTKSITREVFGALPTCTFGAQPNLALATNYQDLWWAAPAASESGWGINFTHQGDTIFATWFTYDLDGSPMWLVVTAAKTAPGTYAGTLYRTTGPAFNAVPFDATKIVSTPVGTATLGFAHGNSATFAYSIGTANGTVNQSKNLTREVFQSPGTVCR